MKSQPIWLFVSDSVIGRTGGIKLEANCSKWGGLMGGGGKERAEGFSHCLFGA
jgi:hypothetical protein